MVAGRATLSPEVLEQATQSWMSVSEHFGTQIVGQKELLKFLFLGLLCEGHILLEGMPGLAKTSSVKTLAQLLALSFKRIQFTPDLLPGDVTGLQLYDQQSGRFRVKLGPIFAQMVLADEINRAPAKVQAALLEAMQERQVTIGDETHYLERPFFVLATQNPIDQEGTYQLPEAQIDRFLFKVVVDYGTLEEEKRMLAILHDEEIGDRSNKVAATMTQEQLLALQQAARAVHVSEPLRDYIVRLVTSTRPGSAQAAELAKRGLEIPKLLVAGASPRASICIEQSARAHALIHGRDHATPEDVKEVALPVLRHRLMLSFGAISAGQTSDGIVQQLLRSVPIAN